MYQLSRDNAIYDYTMDINFVHIDIDIDIDIDSGYRNNGTHYIVDKY